MEEKNIIELRNIKKVFEDDDTTVVEDFNLEVKKGEFVTFSRTVRLWKDDNAPDDRGI